MIRKLLLASLLFFPLLAMAQFNLEHTYTEGLTKKITLEYSGDKYYTFNNLTNTLNFYNADHSYWKSIVLTVPAAATITSYDQISESIIDPNPAIELVYSYSYSVGGEPAYATVLIGEGGLVYLTLPNAPSAKISHIEGLPDKLIVQQYFATSAVYSLPFGFVEHNYNDVTGINTRIKLENSGEKYAIVDVVAHQVLLYNADHTLWKTVNLPFTDDGLFYQVSLISETAINPDPQIEVAFNYYTFGTGFNFEGKIVNEAGTSLLTLADTGSFELSQIPGLETKLLAYGSGFNANPAFTNVYELPSLELEHTYSSPMTRTKLENSGEKYFSKYVTANSTDIFNADHSLWKTVALPVSDVIFAPIRINSVSENVINSDNLVQVAYTSRYILGDIVYFYYSTIVNELGDVLLDIEDAANLYPFQIDGQTKLLADLFSDDAFSNTVQGQVYSIGTLGSRKFESADVLLYPNPVSSTVKIFADAAISSVLVYDTAGKLIREISRDAILNIDFADFKSGLYMLRLTDVNGNTTVKKIIVRH